ncbi:hypothetical protein COU36_02780 [Candidatus Micrarchaeota archaeon CG10_big_fil_rev_8_21_14_0_10_59_7]|nr:MAG: hypothetical protein COU36_02780 [Candidatus Micrarchaeota archaeon CG10_big_fil_rev_8_21_14_0_10_59_7]
MDYTFLFIVILMLFAVKSGLYYVAVGLFVLLLFTAKNKYLIAAAVVGGGIALMWYSGMNLGDYSMIITVGGLFLVLLLIAKKESDQPQGYGGGGGGMFG